MRTLSKNVYLEKYTFVDYFPICVFNMDLFCPEIPLNPFSHQALTS